MPFLERLGKFIDGLVRPIITLGAGATIAYMAIVSENRDAQVALLTIGATVIGFWFKDRNTDKAADAAAEVVKATAGGTTVTTPEATTVTVAAAPDTAALSAGIGDGLTPPSREHLRVE